MNPKKVVRVIVPRRVIRPFEQSYRKSRGVAVSTTNGRPARKLKVIAVTGTNGKTTTCTYINNILKEAGFKTAIQTTVFSEIDGKYSKAKGDHTTGTTKETNQFFRQAKRAKVDYVILETTSQALDQYKLYGVKIFAAGITNLSYEHIEYHRTMDNYAKAKARLLQRKPKIIALNGDDEWYDFFNKYPAREKKLSYGKEGHCRFRMINVKNDIKGSSCNIELDGQKILNLHTNIIGEYNLYNATLAAAITHAIGIDKKHIEKGISNLDWIDGRMNYIDHGQPFAVFCDYAHTPDGLEQVMKTLKPVTKGKVILVQSTMDGRDKAKRPMMGEIAAKWADSIYVTDEEAFKEPTEKLRADIIEGIKKSKAIDKLHEIADRQKAINAAIKEARAGDSVLIIPFGHFTQRTFYGKTEHWDDREAAGRALDKIGYSKDKNL